MCILANCPPPSAHSLCHSAWPPLSLLSSSAPIYGTPKFRCVSPNGLGINNGPVAVMMSRGQGCKAPDSDLISGAISVGGGRPPTGRAMGGRDVRRKTPAFVHLLCLLLTKGRCLASVRVKVEKAKVESGIRKCEKCQDPGAGGGRKDLERIRAGSQEGVRRRPLPCLVP